MICFMIVILFKGWFKDKLEEWFGKSGFKLCQKGGGCGYCVEFDGFVDVDVMLLLVCEIVEGLIDGQIYIGVIGEDLLYDLFVNVVGDFDVLY